MLTSPFSTAESSLLQTKAKTLANLANRLQSAKILPLAYFTVAEWETDQQSVIAKLSALPWFAERLVVRSSAISEDTEQSSLAGYFDSVIDVSGVAAFVEAVTQVIASYQGTSLENEVLVQPLLKDVASSGVLFTQDPNIDGHYLVINYDDSSGDTTSITSGQSNQKCYIHHHFSPYQLTAPFDKIQALANELKALLKHSYLDIEFAFTRNAELYLFQVRPLLRQIKSPIALETHQQALLRIEQKVGLGMKSHPYLHGQRTIYGIMPDWNPAEIIGVRPKPLALSLYRELITDSVWAYQRDNYGYANLRSFPLLVDFEGLPYIDVRVSFNSFLPKEIPAELKERLVNYYLERLISTPALHDKIEFDIVFTCYTLDLDKRLTILDNYGFSEEDRSILTTALVRLTNRIINNHQGLWKKDLEKIHKLHQRQSLFFASDQDPISKMYWILEDCKRYGTLPFAGLARAGFIAIQILKSFVAEEIINEQEYTNFLTSINSVSSMMNADFCSLSKSEFLEKYGHLRPGTYDILSPRYDEEPDLYFNWHEQDAHCENNQAHIPFALTIPQLRKIQEYITRDNLETTALELLEFIKIAIEAREYSKFIFTRSVSEFLKICSQFSEEFGLTREDCAYLNVQALRSLYTSSVDIGEALHKSVSVGKNLFNMTSAIHLPPLITSQEQVWSFKLSNIIPNFITQKSATGQVVFQNAPKDALKDAILLIPSADPGYDWIFAHHIAGFITEYGGVNSHMAIRAGELGIPAIIGAGELKFAQWSKAKKLHIDCLNKQVQVL